MLTLTAKPLHRVRELDPPSPCACAYKHVAWCVAANCTVLLLQPCRRRGRRQLQLQLLDRTTESVARAWAST
jgi:hypothetical protein